MIEWFVKLNGTYLAEDAMGWVKDADKAETFGRDIDAMVRMSGIASRMGRREGDFDITYRHK